MKLISALLLMTLSAAAGEAPDEALVIAPRSITGKDIAEHIGKLRGSDKPAALEAAAWLGAAHAKEASKALLDFYRAGNAEARMAASRALAELGDPAQAEWLLNIALFDRSIAIRRLGAAGLGSLAGAQDAASRFEAAADDVKYSEVVRNRAIHYAARVQGAPVESWLRKELQGELGSALAAAEELGEIRTLGSVDALLAELSGSDAKRAEVRSAALEALERLTGQKLGFNLAKWQEWRGKVGDKEFSATGASAPIPVGNYAREPVDFVIAFDTTGSFLHVWAEISRVLDAVLKEMNKQEPNLRVGLIRYRSVVAAATLKYTLWPTALTYDSEQIRKELGHASFGGGSGALHEALRFALDGMLWREHSRKFVLVIGDDSPVSPVENALQAALLAAHEGAEFDGMQFDTLYAKTSAGVENRVTYERIAAAGLGRFYEYDKAEKHLVEKSAVKIEVKKVELPEETVRKLLSKPELKK